MSFYKNPVPCRQLINRYKIVLNEKFGNRVQKFATAVKRFDN